MMPAWNAHWNRHCWLVGSAHFCTHATNVPHF
jgi:hypothetical protein